VKKLPLDFWFVFDRHHLKFEKYSLILHLPGPINCYRNSQNQGVPIFSAGPPLYLP